MKSLGSVVHHILISSVVVLGLAVGCSACDTKWIRMVYMLSCGKKKRENGAAGLPGVQKKLVLPPHLLYQNRTEDSQPLGRTLLRAMIGSRESTPQPKTTRNPAIHAMASDISFSGMRGKDASWILEDLMGEMDTNELHRREINSLIDKCCRVPPTSSCSAKDFVGACK